MQCWEYHSIAIGYMRGVFSSDQQKVTSLFKVLLIGMLCELRRWIFLDVRTQNWRYVSSSDAIRKKVMKLHFNTLFIYLLYSVAKSLKLKVQGEIGHSC